MTEPAPSARTPETGLAPSNERASPESVQFICALDHLSVLRVTGNDAASFLQGQFTNDILKLDIGGAQRTGYCSPKGRLLADFLALRDEAGYWLLLDRSLAESIRKRLTMFVMRAKVKIDDVTEAWQPFGFVSRSEAPSAPVLSPDDASAWPVPMAGTGGTSPRIGLEPVDGIAPPWQRMIALLPPAAADGFRAGSDDRWPLAPSDWWHTGEALVGTPHIRQELSDAFVPQMINFELVGGVDFKKGCYTGQEVVARTQYLGKLKRRLSLGWTHQAARAGDELSDHEAQPAGIVVLSGPGEPVGRSGEYAVLFESRVEALAGTLTLGGQPVDVTALPYEIPVAERFERPRDL